MIPSLARFPWHVMSYQKEYVCLEICPYQLGSSNIEHIGRRIKRGGQSYNGIGFREGRAEK